MTAHDNIETRSFSNKNSPHTAIDIGLLYLDSDVTEEEALATEVELQSKTELRGGALK